MSGFSEGSLLHSKGHIGRDKSDVLGDNFAFLGSRQRHA
jgi:hypothetical protein